MNTDAVNDDNGAPEESRHTIAISDSDIRAARRLLARLAEVDLIDAHFPEALPTIQADNVSAATLRRRARALFNIRRRRAKIFGQSMFGEPAWDMLLALYVLEEYSDRHTVGRVMRYAGTPTTTGLRWLQYLVGKQLVIREEHPHDRRSALVRLSPKGQQLLNAFFSEVVDSGAQP
jgi:DNA-binding MarR family transcriptional regulator